MQVILAQPRSFCAGVVRAIDIVKHALKLFGPPVYVLHEIVHNGYVLEDLRKLGAIFVAQIHEIPVNSVIVFSAHGVAQSKFEEAQARNLTVIDATCPLVTKVHKEVIAFARNGQEVILIGHPNHVEVQGTLGQYLPYAQDEIHIISTPQEAATVRVRDPENLGYVTQTTLSIYDTEAIIQILHSRFPSIQGPRKDDICYATQNRQQGVVDIIPDIDILLVVGAQNSSNSNRLRELGENRGVPSYLIQSVDQIQPAWFKPHTSIGITAGASTPEYLVKGVVDYLKTLGAKRVKEATATPENVFFPLPQILRKTSSS